MFSTIDKTSDGRLPAAICTIFSGSDAHHPLVSAGHVFVFDERYQLSERPDVPSRYACIFFKRLSLKPLAHLIRQNRSSWVTIISMSAEFFDPPHNRNGLPDGWTGWVEPEKLRMGHTGTPRPWCRGRVERGLVAWFPRTTQDPFGDERFAVDSPADQLHGLSRSGWWICNAFVNKQPSFDPDGEPIGILPSDILDRLYQRLDGLYWYRQ